MTAFQALTRLVDGWALDRRLSGDVHTDPDFITVPLPGGLIIRVYLDDCTTRVAVFDHLMCCEWTVALGQAPAAVLYAVLCAAADTVHATATSTSPTRTGRNHP
jgi:hypothetical protein